MDLDSIKAMANAAIMDDISNDDVDLEGTYLREKCDIYVFVLFILA